LTRRPLRALRGTFNVTLGKHLPRKDQGASFATYAFGILGDSERKSVKPIAARAYGDKAQCGRVHDRLLYFVREGAWSDRQVRREAARYAK
jgi:SRSO17 transposase